VGVGYIASRFLLPPIFHFVARQPELVLVGALAWCFALAGFARYLGLSPEMGALVAGVMVSTFPYTLDVISKVTSLRDFFVTLFFVGLGMSIPVPTWDIALWMLAVSLFVIVSRLLTIIPVLHALRLGQRVSLLPAINLCQISELSLVLLALGHATGDVSEKSIGIAAFAFAFLAVASTYAINKNDALLRVVSPWLTRLGFADLPAAAGPDISTRPARIVLLGFSWTASSLLEEMKRQASHLLDEVSVVDFNPVVIERLRARGVRVIYGDISQRETLLHAGLAHAKIIICSLPDMLFKGASNRRLLKQLQELNPDAKIIIHSDNVAELASLYADGASYISVPRLLEADDLLRAIEAAEKSLLGEKRDVQLARIGGRDEVIP
jgi:Kef-type K+ transport system membrane component KefB